MNDLMAPIYLLADVIRFFVVPLLPIALKIFFLYGIWVALEQIFSRKGAINRLKKKRNKLLRKRDNHNKKMQAILDEIAAFNSELNRSKPSQEHQDPIDNDDSSIDISANTQPSPDFGHEAMKVAQSQSELVEETIVLREPVEVKAGEFGAIINS